MSRRINPAQTITTSDATIIDSPAWGSPTQHSLNYLLNKYPRKKCILFQNPHYIVINKPPDLRMDGNYPATVQKLLLYWYPPPSLATASDSLSNISRMTNPPSDLELRHAHQLDYATSGVLLFARSRQAASAAQQAFAARQVKKTYLAIVHGHLHVNKEWPILPRETLEKFSQYETIYRKQRSRKRNDTFQGYMPPSAVFQKWKAHYLKQQSQNDSSTQQKPKRPKRGHGQSIDVGVLWKQALVGEEASWSTDELNEMKGSTWKQVKKNEKWKAAMERLATLYNDETKRRIESTSNDTMELPKLFRIEGEPANAFFIYAPIAEVEDDFSMRVKPGTLSPKQSRFEGTFNLDYKPSLTRCLVLQTGMSSGVTLTKVQLEPRTGRRHQLRLHMLVAGTSIVGDATYELDKGLCCYPRMCLHAQSLSLQVLGGDLLDVSAPDPFEFDNDGELVLESELEPL